MTGSTYEDITRDSAHARVSVGAALLDRRAAGWITRVDLDVLDLRDNDHCVLGQVYRRPMADLEAFQPGFDAGRIDLFGVGPGGFASCAEHGFYTDIEVSDPPPGIGPGSDDWDAHWSDAERVLERRYGLLEEAWRELIEDRLLGGR